MKYTYIAIVILSIINIVIACINLYTNGRSERIAERLDAINTRLNVHDKAIKGAYQSIEDGADIDFELHNDLEKLKKNAEHTHRLTMDAYNSVKKIETDLKHASKGEEENKG